MNDASPSPLDYLDLKLEFNPALRGCDFALDESGDLSLDTTPATPMMISLGSDRRARIDDILPSGRDSLNDVRSFSERRGWHGDALDYQGRRIGSRLWLLDRAKQTEQTRILCEEWAKEAFQWVLDETGQEAEITAAWIRSGVLYLICRIGRTTIRRGITGFE